MESGSYRGRGLQRAWRSRALYLPAAPGLRAGCSPRPAGAPCGRSLYFGASLHRGKSSGRLRPAPASSLPQLASLPAFRPYASPTDSPHLVLLFPPLISVPLSFHPPRPIAPSLSFTPSSPFHTLFSPSPRPPAPRVWPLQPIPLHFSLPLPSLHFPSPLPRLLYSLSPPDSVPFSVSSPSLFPTFLLES